MTDDRLIQTMADIGFMACSEGLSKQAFGIFSAIEKIRPDSVLPSIGFSMVFMNKKMNQEALEILHKEAMNKDPDNPFVKAFIGMVLGLEGRNKESEEYLSVIELSDSPEAHAMASELSKGLHKD